MGTAIVTVLAESNISGWAPGEFRRGPNSLETGVWFEWQDKRF